MIHHSVKFSPSNLSPPINDQWRKTRWHFSPVHPSDFQFCEWDFSSSFYVCHKLSVLFECSWGISWLICKQQRSQFWFHPKQFDISSVLIADIFMRLIQQIFLFLFWFVAKFIKRFYVFHHCQCQRSIWLVKKKGYE